ncbi:electron transfer flavoprotein-ubiquinone oxidoreductase [Pelagibacterium flavum]|uniref:Electron transfer flavoprotein-ubiquinone oxidoreductase n=1 Tax=Pelagibacterium flavum TaxID=2984530 RepID=A0ABY6ILK6_9HYPH|nr:electron transfer flavoprotein-ubiquinone oxidoreductase [Pelagibacterium sp. YIM 151497]MAN89189.1 electron transfer flavoprotein-ubiquinone oxidoreductase [Algoriphagus sp.]UYQ71478.1 electron transfer flavoprotein-ubiquinone oxidoreductase [Pelagibacterium sp. YIM 151497]
MADAIEREMMETGVVIVGAGPAGLSAAIALKQKSPDLEIVVVEKSADIGGHILSGAVMDPAGLDTLIPDWREKGAPVGPDVTEDSFVYLTEKSAIAFPDLLIPPIMKTKGAVIISLGDLCRWLAEQAEALGVDIFPGTAAADFITGENGEILGIVTGDMGVARDGSQKPTFTPGIELRAKYTLIAEGARGSLAKRLIAKFGLAEGRAAQKYGLGIKEIWEIDPAKHKPGKVTHFMGYPMGNSTSGGGFCYHAQDNKIYLGLVAHLDYENPTFSPFGEFQRFKQHPEIAKLLEGATCLSYGARALTSGGWQSIPKMAFPGGALIGCSAGFMNVPRLKAIHNAIRSGMAAAAEVASAITAGRANDEIATLDEAILSTGIRDDLYPVRAVKPLWSKLGTFVGVGLAGADMWVSSLAKLSPLGGLVSDKPDFARLKPIAEVTPIAYPKPDGKTSFSRTESVYRANIAHEEDQPVHLRLTDPEVPIRDNLPKYGEPAPLYCPAGVYEVVEEAGDPVFRINAQNCVHCKTCDIKDPAQNINWVPPEGGSGPNYSGM